jgi:hypothetical protein
MSDIVEKAVEALMSLPKPERDRIAWEIVERIEDKSEWDRLVASPRAQMWLEKRAEEAIKIYKDKKKRLSFHLISLPAEEYLREDSYWKEFDELPPEARKMAEKNYKLWKESPSHPSLRFKQIHEKQPIFSFRVGLKYRTIGVQTRDEKLAWFWVGSFEQFRDAINEHGQAGR